METSHGLLIPTSTKAGHRSKGYYWVWSRTGRHAFLKYLKAIPGDPPLWGHWEIVAKCRACVSKTRGIIPGTIFESLLSCHFDIQVGIDLYILKYQNQLVNDKKKVA